MTGRPRIGGFWHHLYLDANGSVREISRSSKMDTSSEVDPGAVAKRSPSLGTALEEGNDRKEYLSGIARGKKEEWGNKKRGKGEMSLRRWTVRAP